MLRKPALIRCGAVIQSGGDCITFFINNNKKKGEVMENHFTDKATRELIRVYGNEGFKRICRSVNEKIEKNPIKLEGYEPNVFFFEDTNTVVIDQTAMVPYHNGRRWESATIWKGNVKDLL